MSMAGFWFRTSALGAVCAFGLAGCSLARQPKFHPDRARDLFSDVALSQGDEVALLRDAAPSDGFASISRPAYRLAPGDVVEVVFHVLTQPDLTRYEIGVRDTLSIDVDYHPDMSVTEVVRPDGKVTAPLIGELSVLGLSADEAASKIQSGLSVYIREPRAHVSVTRHEPRLSAFMQATASDSGGQSVSAALGPDGRISLPLIGESNAAGFSIAQLRDHLGARYAELDSRIGVSVLLEQIQTPQVYVTGQVASPGAYPIDGRVGAAHALALAGGVLETGDATRVVLVKNEGYDGSLAYRINVERMWEEGRVDRDVALSANDLIYVPSAAPPQIWVAGQVEEPGPYPFVPGMDIFDAMAWSRGVLDTADLRSVVVIRRQGVERPVAFRVNLAKTLFKGDTRYNLQLREGDAIYFPKTFIARVDLWIQQWFTNGIYDLFPGDSSLDFLLDLDEVRHLDEGGSSTQRTR